MGRAKVPMKLVEDPRKRLSTYKIRAKGLLKKAMELATLCGVDVLLTLYNPDLNATQIWPEDPSDFRRITDRYRRLSSAGKARSTLQGNSKRDTPILCHPSPAISTSLDQEELAALEEKIHLIQQRILSLEGEELRQGTSIQLHQGQDVYQALPSAYDSSEPLS